MKKFHALAISAACLAGSLAAAAPAMAAPITAGVTVQDDVIRNSFACSSPKGAKLNTSYKPGITSVTVYFNNHCSTKMAISMHYELSDPQCFTVNPKTKGRKKLHDGAITITKLTATKGSC
ncbi:hypothetical protein E1295_13850 [Nonomuraea mesophila]|uniref:Uncharacterized protein n=1 Tax=Nonomuraea mesophila TaxID=2530382 RepID=A0A4V2ZB69_9ACTN|nr:hypothetical protein [Nonomuraea mesophila]TDE55622.1 hypothetical protein E1295_13850 [Nonomuraea mesophila]